MSDKNLTTFLTEWGGQVKELIEPKQEKLTPEFYLGSKANPESEIYSERNDDGSGINYQSYEYIGDGELSIESYVPSGIFDAGSSDVLRFDKNYNGKIGFKDTVYTAYTSSGTATITSAETDNYKAGEWVFPFTVRVHSD